MKSIFILFFVFISCFSSFAQFEEKNFIFSLEIDRINYTNTKPFVTGGLGLEYFLTDKLSCSSRITFGKNYVHMPLTVYFFADLFVHALLTSEEDDYYWLVFFSEGLNYHFEIRDEISISPYAYPLGCEYFYQERKPNEIYVKENEKQKNWYFTGSFGVRVNLFFEEFMISPYVEYKTLYTKKHQGFAFGLNIGLSLY